MPRWSSFDPSADRRLLKGLNDTDTDTFAALYDAYAERLYDYSVSMVCETKAATDIVHDVFIDAYRRAPRLRDRLQLRSWLYGAARRRCLQRGRARGLNWGWSDSSEWTEVADADLGLSPRGLRKLLEMSLARLDFADQETLFLTLRHGLSSADLAAAFGLPNRRAARRVARARTRVDSAINAELRSLARRCAAGQTPARALDAADAEAELIVHTAAARTPFTPAAANPANPADPDAADTDGPGPDSPGTDGPDPDISPDPGADPDVEAELSDGEDPDASPAPSVNVGLSGRIDRSDGGEPDDSAGADTSVGADPEGGGELGVRVRLGARPYVSGSPGRGVTAGLGGVDGPQIDGGRWARVIGAGRGAEAGEETAYAQHVEECPACRRRTMVSAVPLFGLAPAPVLPAALRHRVMHTATDSELAGYRADIAGRGGSLTPDGLPRQPDVPSQFTRRWMFAGGSAVGALSTAVTAALVIAPVTPEIRWPFDPRPRPPSDGSRQASDQARGRAPFGQGPSGGAGPAAPGVPGQPGPPGQPDRPDPPGPNFPANPPIVTPSSPTSPPTRKPRSDPPPEIGKLSVHPHTVTLDKNRSGVIVLKASRGPVTWSAMPSSDALSLSLRMGTLSEGGTVEVGVMLTNVVLINLPGRATVTFTDREGRQQNVKVKWGLRVL